MEFEFELNTTCFLLGIDFSDCIAEDIDSGDQFETKTLSIGFLFFTLIFHFHPNKK